MERTTRRRPTRRGNACVLLVLAGSLATGAARATEAPPDLLYVRLTDGYWQVWEATLATDEHAQRTRTPFDKRYPRWGPDGSVYFRSNNDELYRQPASGGTAEPILREHWPALGPAPHPRDARLAFARMRKDVQDNSAVLVQQPDGSGLATLTGSAGLRLHVDWHPDGDRVVYARSLGGEGAVIEEVPAAGGEVRTLVEHPSRNLQPAYAPTGDRLAFVSNRSGDYDLWVSPGGPDAAARRVVALPSRQWSPTWAPAGDRLAFATRHTGREEVWVTTLATGDVRPLFEVGVAAMDPHWRRASR